MPRTRELFTTITSQGGLLPPDLLQRIAAGDRGLPGLRPEDYDLLPGQRLGEAANAAWNVLVGAWSSFRPLLPQARVGDPLTAQTRDRWLRVLFRMLDFGHLPQGRAIELEDRSYPVFTVWGQRTKVPLHLVGAGVDLDHRVAGVAGAARQSPHSLVQELLNEWDEALWGVVTNGRCLRILRDSSKLTRQSYLEFDLEEMMEGSVYADFVLLWTMLHAKCFDADRPEHCRLEQWRDRAEQDGTRVLQHLRDGVERALVALGQGFLAYPTNQALRERLRSGTLSREEYYQLLLRLVYRLLFLLVGEARDRLLLPDAPMEARERYRRFYSMARLRLLAERRHEDRHGDLWEALRVVMDALDETGLDALGLRAQGSFLWRPEAIGDLGACRLTNSALLNAVDALCVTRPRGEPIRSVDYKNLGPEELGGVYESLLELHPELNVDVPTFSLQTAGGNERRTTGSYYTPSELIQSLLDTALDPVLDEAAQKASPQQAILALRVVDPACGSGHFLLAAAQRMARRLASVSTGEGEPPLDAVQEALRDVIANCLRAVDVNPLAVELCKVSLWMEAMDPTRPLSFLDHRILCGHSLLGATPRLVAEGIPDAAFKPIEGDDRATVSSWRRDNKKGRGGQLWLPFERLAATVQSALAEGMREVERSGDDSITGVRLRELRFRELLESPERRRLRLAADAWCAAFVAPKKQGDPPITERWRRQLAEDPNDVPAPVRARVDEIAMRYRFFHWHLEFPDIFRVPAPNGGELAENQMTGWSGGFDVVLGNPPWERVKLQEQEFFASRDPEIAAIAGARRKQRIAQLRSLDPALDAAYRDALRQSEGASHFLLDSGRYPLCGRGDVNTYSVFAETMRTLIAPEGRAGIIVPSGIATDDTTKQFFGSLIDSRNLASLYDFENRSGLFPDVDSRQKFCLLTMTGPRRPMDAGEFCFFAHSTDDLADPDRRFHLSPEDFRLFNPNTKTCPIFRTRRDAEITRRIYERVPVLIDRTKGEDGNPWGVSFMSMFHMTNDSALFRTREELETAGFALRGNVYERGEERYVPLYEGKMVSFYDHRAADIVISPTATQRQAQPAPISSQDHQFIDRLARPHYWVQESLVAQIVGARAVRPWLLATMDVTSSTNWRTVVPAAIPYAGVGNNLPCLLVRPDEQHLAHCLLSCLSSFVFDYQSRFKVGGNHLNFFIFEQLPALTPEYFAFRAAWDSRTSVGAWIAPRIAELTCTAIDMAAFASVLGCGMVAFKWDESRRELLRAELDAALFHLYRLPRRDAAYVMDTFPIVRRADEQMHGEYRTKRLILERYDALGESITTGEPYQTVLDPPPADPRVAHGVESGAFSGLGSRIDG